MAATASSRAASSAGPFRVLRVGANPPRSFYARKKLKQGLNYVTMRDGVELAMTVRLPAGKKLSDGPFPTVIEHSGYQVAAPHDLLQSIGKHDDPLAPATSTAVGSLIAPLLDFAVVSVQMRGSGCSGGAFDLFDLPDHLRRLRRGRGRRRAEVGQGRQGRAWSASRSPGSPSCSPPAPSRRTWRRSRRCR